MHLGDQDFAARLIPWKQSHVLQLCLTLPPLQHRMHHVHLQGHITQLHLGLQKKL